MHIKNIKFSKLTHRKILNKEEFFAEFYTGTFSDFPSDIYTSVLEDDSSSKYSSDSNNVNIRTKIRQKAVMIDYDT